jgi:hypothetical protein
MSDIAANDFGFLVGAFAIMGAALGIRIHLPQARLAALDKILRETRRDLNSAVESGVNAAEGHEFHEKLIK